MNFCGHRSWISSRSVVLFHPSLAFARISCIASHLMHRWSLIALITIMIVTGLHAYRAGVIRYAGRLMTRRNMNRLLCEVTEVNIDEITQKMTVLLKKEDPRAKHIKEVVYGLFLKVCIFGTRLTCRCLNFRCCTCNQATPSEVRSLTWE